MSQVGLYEMSEVRATLRSITQVVGSGKEGMRMAKPSKSSLSKAGSTLASNSSSKSSKSKAGSTLGKG